MTLEPCGHPDIDANGKCGTCQYQFVATLTDAAGEVTGYDTLNGALAEVKALSADAQNASRYTVRLHRNVTEDVRITGGKFTLDLNGKTATVPSGLAISGTTDIGIQNGKLVSDVTVSSASLTVSAAEGWAGSRCRAAPTCNSIPTPARRPSSGERQRAADHERRHRGHHRYDGR